MSVLEYARSRACAAETWRSSAATSWGSSSRTRTCSTRSLASRTSLALTLRGELPRAIEESVIELARVLGIEEVLQKHPEQMSGGQRQRVAAARAVIGNTKLILADEPTGALDSKSSAVLLDVFENMNTRMGATILMVMHDAFAASYATRIVFLRDGRLFNEVDRGNAARSDYYQRIMDVMAFLGGDADAR